MQFSNKKIWIFTGLFFIIFVVIHFLQPGNYLKDVYKKRLLLSFLLSLLYTLSFVLQYYFFKTKLHIKSLNFYLSNIYFLILNSILILIIVYFLHPYLPINNYYKILFTVLSFTFLLQIIFVLFLIKNRNKTEFQAAKPFYFSDNSLTISIPHDDLYFVRASGNYIEIIESNNNKGHVLRSSLKEIEEKYPELYRCHKSYLVNMENIKSISGNTKGYELSFHNINISKIPVARGKGKFIKNKLN